MTDHIGSCPILKVNGESLERLKIVMSLSDETTAVGYAIDKERNRLVFFKYASENMTPFPAPLDMDQCAMLAFAWLAKATYPQEPDHDGDNSEGWLCLTENWGHIEPFGYSAFLAIEPHWLQYGK